MKVLGIDTSTLVLSVAVVEDGKLLGEYTTNLKKNHSIRIMPAISMLLDELDSTPADLDGIAVGNGPGSYTGVRIGVTTAKSLAWSLDVPLVGVSSLEALAANALAFEGIRTPMFDARRGQVYTTLYQKDQCLIDQGIYLIDNWLAKLAQFDQQVLFVGDDVALHLEKIQAKLAGQALFAPAEWGVPRAAYIARKGMDLIKSGISEDVRQFVPQYLQLAEAEAKWLANQTK
jgi:tRNA threonylcarbamoyladenosine biosynthesis protein TsaB